jgi:hypothetical protein
MMTTAELLTVLKNQLGDSIKYANDDFNRVNIDLDNAYRQNPYGNEEPDHSQVISSDVYDTVESDMPALARIFLGSTDIMKFIPLGANDVEEAEQKTQYANFLIRGQRDSFKTIHDLLKEPGKAQCSVAYFYVEDVTKPEYVFYEGLSEDEMTIVMEDLKAGDDVSKVEIESKDEDEGRYTVRFRVVKETQKITFTTVPGESFIISRGARDKDSAMLVGHESTKTKGELIAEGYDKETVKKLSQNSGESSDELKENRFENQGGWDQKSGYHWTNDEVTIQTLFPLVDWDEDDIPERRMVVKCGQEILENEPYGIVPYAIFSQLLEPHSAIGHSRGEQAARYQIEKTAIKRGLMDNIYEVNRPRIAVDDSDGSIDGGKVDLDDLLTHRIGGLIRVDGMPAEALMPIVTPYIGDKALQVIQYLDAEKTLTLGNQMAHQGLDSDQLYKETATRFRGVESAQQAKLELVARVYAETGFRELYEGMIWLAQHYQDSATEIMVLGETLIIDPRQWRYSHYCRSQVGLAAGDSQESIANLVAVIQQQMGLIQAQSPLVDWAKLYNSLDDLTRLMGEPDSSRYWNNPEKPQELLMFENMQLMQAIQGMQQQMEQLSQNNPLAEAELIKAKASMITAQSKTTTDWKKFILTMAQDNKEFRANLAKDLTEMELKFQRDVPGSTV